MHFLMMKMLQNLIDIYFQKLWFSINLEKTQNNWWISNFLESVVAESVVVIKKLLQMQVSFEYSCRELIIYQYLDFALKIKRCG